MFKKHFSLGGVVISLLLLGSSVVFAQGEKETKFGIGFQSAYRWGISGMVDVAPNISVQGILAPFSDMKAYVGRGIYRFRIEPHWNTYGYGMIGAWSHPWDKLEGEILVEETETTMGFGIGAGIEYNWQGRFPNLPPVWWNFELGITKVKFEEADHLCSVFMFGLGVHYRF